MEQKGERNKKKEKNTRRYEVKKKKTVEHMNEKQIKEKNKR